MEYSLSTVTASVARPRTSPPTSDRRSPLIHLGGRVLTAVVLGIACFPAALQRPLPILISGALAALAAIVLTLAPSRSAATVHDRQLDHILVTVGCVTIGWIALTWSPKDPVVAVVLSGLLAVVAALLLVGTRTVTRLWPVGLAWAGVALEPGLTTFVLLALLAAVLVVRVRKRQPQLTLNQRDLGVPAVPNGILPLIVLVAVAAPFGWGLVG